jgi:hypothetical protein
MTMTIRPVSTIVLISLYETNTIGYYGLDEPVAQRRQLLLLQACERLGLDIDGLGEHDGETGVMLVWHRTPAVTPRRDVRL